MPTPTLRRGWGPPTWGIPCPVGPWFSTFGACAVSITRHARGGLSAHLTSLAVRVPLISRKPTRCFGKELSAPGGRTRSPAEDKTQRSVLAESQDAVGRRVPHWA